ncbi:hypothetical protein FA15DRAFT_664093 [Coprinopsis marcescibilis]|uniref:Cora-domain-containing protein n=1 Tax=Coprinopsis marcescibilis TaxID=230819 RepID=A0A5C3L933_COPMA|nr:hypothetical protein FA15DRAFT_664093 [Coprinopsis marcescibilis]
MASRVAGTLIPVIPAGIKVDKELGGVTRIAPPPHRHAAPSAPWPWVDIHDGVDQKQLTSLLPPIPERCPHVDCSCWTGYPKSRFPNWTEAQVKKSKILDAIQSHSKDIVCKIHHATVDSRGEFRMNAGTFVANDDKKTWDFLVKKQKDSGEDVRVRALFVESMSGPVLQMLGARYNIEPFFFSSSLNWIPTRFQEEVVDNVGDHITVTLTFLRSMPANTDALRLSARSPYSAVSGNTLINGTGLRDLNLVRQMIDTQAPLELSSGRLLVLDLLSVHLIRRKSGSVIISFHPNLDLPTTTAPYLHERIRFAGQSVYWQNIFKSSTDPTFVLLTYLWHALYAWDEALENLYTHICHLETQVIHTSEMNITQDLHIIRAHHLHYTSLLEDFKKTIEFVAITQNPALQDLPKEEQDWNSKVMERETLTLLSEVERLEKSSKTQDRRLRNVMNLVFSTVNIIDSKRMQQMTEAAARDSAAMKQIAYLTMVFLPASFVATVFGMNVKQFVPDSLGTIPQYVATALPLTLMTIWIITASQSKYMFPADSNIPFWKRLGWPVLLLLRRFGKDPYLQAEVQAQDEAPLNGVPKLKQT